jgi:hypothetical protein
VKKNLNRRYQASKQGSILGFLITGKMHKKAEEENSVSIEPSEA